MLRISLAVALLLASVAASAKSIEEKAAACGACHGLEGVPEDKSTPIIWGQHAGYLFIQLRDFQRGARKAEPMATIAPGLSRQDALPLAEYFAAKPWPATGAPAASKAEADTAMVAINSVVCTSCHLEQFQGDSSVPRLAGQERDYLLKTMMDFRNHTRANSPTMSDFMNSITPEQIAAIAAYLAGL
jgi:cytochrome c553